MKWRKYSMKTHSPFHSKFSIFGRKWWMQINKKQFFLFRINMYKNQFHRFLLPGKDLSFIQVPISFVSFLCISVFVLDFLVSSVIFLKLVVENPIFFLFLRLFLFLNRTTILSQQDFMLPKSIAWWVTIFLFHNIPSLGNIVSS